MTTTAKIAVGVYATALAGSAVYCGYWLQHIIRHGRSARTPLEAWIVARLRAMRIDREWREASINQKKVKIMDHTHDARDGLRWLDDNFQAYRCRQCGHRVYNKDLSPVRQTRSLPLHMWLLELKGRRAARKSVKYLKG